MEDDDIQISDSEEARASVSRLIKSIESWASKESQKNELELTAFGAALSLQELFPFMSSLPKTAETLGPSSEPFLG